MGTDLSIVMCYRDFGDHWRRRSFEYAWRWYLAAAAELGAELVVDTTEGGHAKAINAGVTSAAGDAIVLVDSDSLVPASRIRTAARLAWRPGLVVAHDRYCYLTDRATELVYGGREPFSLDFGPRSRDLHWRPGKGVGNAVAFSRDTWSAVGGYDERFHAWGGDDTAFHLTCEAALGPTRWVPGPVVHLWHERPVEEAVGRPVDVEALLQRYQTAAKAGAAAVLAVAEVETRQRA